ncbi:MAG: hydroxyisourate hydrolase [Patulibacter sp.]
MTSCSTHVLDAAAGAPAAGLGATLTGPDVELALATDDDGRIAWGVELAPGEYRIAFETGSWFAAGGRNAFYPRVDICFEVTGDQPHYHVALLLSPYAYTTYRGS